MANIKHEKCSKSSERMIKGVRKLHTKRVIKKSTVALEDGAAKCVGQPVDLLRINQRLILEVRLGQSLVNKSAEDYELLVEARHEKIKILNNRTGIKGTNTGLAVFENLRFTASSGRGKKIDLTFTLRDKRCSNIERNMVFIYTQAIKITKDGERKRNKNKSSSSSSAGSPGSSSSIWNPMFTSASSDEAMSTSSGYVSTPAVSPSPSSSDESSTYSQSYKKNFYDYWTYLNYFNELTGGRLNYEQLTHLLYANTDLISYYSNQQV